jgi:hypothetical protein
MVGVWAATAPDEAVEVGRRGGDGNTLKQTARKMSKVLVVPDRTFNYCG